MSEKAVDRDGAVMHKGVRVGAVVPALDAGFVAYDGKGKFVGWSYVHSRAVGMLCDRHDASTSEAPRG